MCDRFSYSLHPDVFQQEYINTEQRPCHTSWHPEILNIGCSWGSILTTWNRWAGCAVTLYFYNIHTTVLGEKPLWIGYKNSVSKLVPRLLSMCLQVFLSYAHLVSTRYEVCMLFTKSYVYLIWKAFWQDPRWAGVDNPVPVNVSEIFLNWKILLHNPLCCEVFLLASSSLLPRFYQPTIVVITSGWSVHHISDTPTMNWFWHGLRCLSTLIHH